MKYTKKTLLYSLILLATLSAGIFIGRSLGHEHPFSRSSELFVQQNDNYAYTNPLLDCEVYSDSSSAFLKPFQYKLESLKDEIIKEKLATHVSVYFKDLSYGASFGLAETAQFTPASLLKVPLMIAYLKTAEKDPTLLKKELVFKVDPTQNTLPQNIKPSQSIQPEQSYTIDQLLYYMIVKSDNQAQRLLYNNIRGDDLDVVYTDLGISIPGVKSIEDYMNVKEYASFFRILYNSTYLDRDMSEKALELLTQVDFDDGIRAGITADIPLANKFGERKILYESSDKEILQLHDCGIVYHPKRPYLLCMMTRGDSFDNLTTVLHRISYSVFEEVNNL